MQTVFSAIGGVHTPKSEDRCPLHPAPLLQLRVLGFGLLQNWDVRIGIRPRRKEGLVFLARALDLSLAAVSVRKTQVRHSRWLVPNHFNLEQFRPQLPGNEQTISLRVVSNTVKNSIRRREFTFVHQTRKINPP